jgi:hypothetical protein
MASHKKTLAQSVTLLESGKFCAVPSFLCIDCYKLAEFNSFFTNSVTKAKNTLVTYQFNTCLRC